MLEINSIPLPPHTEDLSGKIVSTWVLVLPFTLNTNGVGWVAQCHRCLRTRTFTDKTLRGYKRHNPTENIFCDCQKDDNYAYHRTTPHHIEIQNDLAI